jgi:hypothetical protein
MQPVSTPFSQKSVLCWMPSESSCSIRAASLLGEASKFRFDRLTTAYLTNVKQEWLFMTTTPSALVCKEIERFLRSPNPEVLCISGAWGVGKTHLWKEVLGATAKSAPKPTLHDYSYVSLFGVDTLDGLRQSIFSNQISLSEDKVAKSWAWGKSKAKETQSLLEQLPKIGPLFATLGALYFSSVRNMIICIDDLERRSDTLEVKDVLGLISFLKEERKCKVVLLLNDGELGDSVEEFRNYFEKTVDVHLRFEPTAEESATIAFVNAGDPEKRVRMHCVALGINNIRIIRKIQRAADDARPLLNGYDPLVVESAEKSIVMLGFSILQGAGAPSLGHLKARTGMTIYKFDKDKVIPEEEERWNNLLDNFNFGSLDELDHELINSLESGYFDPETFKTAADKLQKRVEHHQQDGRFEDAWKPYHESFDDNAGHVLDTLYDAFKKTYKTITFLNLDGTVRLFRDLGRNDQAEELLKFYIDNRNEPQLFWDLDEHAFAGNVEDKGVREAIKAKYKSFGNTEVSMADLLEAMGGTTKGWNMTAVDAIAVLPVEEYTKLFKAERGDRLRRIIKGGLSVRRSGNPTESMKTVAALTVQALLGLAAESKLNARRIESHYGVKLPPEAPVPIAPVPSQ